MGEDASTVTREAPPAPTSTPARRGKPNAWRRRTASWAGAGSRAAA